MMHPGDQTSRISGLKAEAAPALTADLLTLCKTTKANAATSSSVEGFHHFQLIPSLSFFHNCPYG